MARGDDGVSPVSDNVSYIESTTETAKIPITGVLHIPAAHRVFAISELL